MWGGCVLTTRDLTFFIIIVIVFVLSLFTLFGFTYQRARSTGEPEGEPYTAGVIDPALASGEASRFVLPVISTRYITG